jgi:hypothetical protein
LRDPPVEVAEKNASLDTAQKGERV